MKMPFLLRSSDATLVLALALVAAGVSGPGSGDDTVAAQAPVPCELITTDDVEPLAPNTTVADGIAASFQTVGSSACRYTWADGTGRYKLDVILHDAARMYAGMDPDAIKQGLQATVKKDTADAAIADVGEAAVFTADSAAYAHATAYVKGRILQVILDGYDAREKKDQVVSLLSTAVAKL
jgi:hypothetical protein